MKIILVTAYAVNPYKGSEDGTGWNYVLQIARFNKVIAFTRKNNQESIDHFFANNTDLAELKNITFKYFDWPKPLLFWKKGPILSLIYFYFWQANLAFHVRKLRLKFDIAHNLNFHNDWTPSFLWILKKPLVWGPIGHHPSIKKEFILPIYGKKAFLFDRFLSFMKWSFSTFDLFLKICKAKATIIICMHTKAKAKFSTNDARIVLMPTVASEPADKQERTQTHFQVLSIGRFVALKGFDLTIRSFVLFLKKHNWPENAKLVLVGKGPELERMKEIIQTENASKHIEIVEWMEREKLKQIYSNSDVFLFPSHEGAGMVVPEALSYGLPVVCLNNCGPGELIHPESLLKVDFDSYNSTLEQLEMKISQLYTSPEYYKKEKALAISRFENTLNWNKKGEILRNIYDNLN